MTNAAEDTISALEATPLWLADALAVAGTIPADMPAADDAWGIADIIPHLRASDAILAPRIMHVLIRPGATLVGFDERAWADVASAASIALADQITDFVLRRRELVGVLRSLSGEQWALSGEHEMRGTITVAQIAAMIVEHEAEHRVQVESLVAAARP